MSAVLQFPSMVPHPSGGDSIGAPPPPRLKPFLDQLPSTLLTAEKTDSITLSPPSTLPIVTCGSDTSSSTSTGGPLSPTNGLPPQPLFSQPCLLANRYLVTRPVDSSSTTHEAIHIHTQTNLLVKCLPSRTAREVCAQHALLGAQEGIRTPLELIQGSEGRSWLVLAPHYGDMHTYVRTRRRIREAEAQRLFGQVTRVVEQCHSAGLVLRDLKLRKFVFTDATRRTVSLESLEDSVLSGGEDTLEDKHGCPAYVAPEILRAAAYSGRAADMWSLGVMLYTMIIGRYPFHGGDTNALFLKIRAGDFVVPEWVSSRARHLIQLLLQRDPASRPTAARVLAHPWLNRAPRDLQLRDAMDHRVPEVIREQPLVRTRRSVFYDP